MTNPAHQLDVFLPRLQADLVRRGMSEEVARFHCEAIRVGTAPPKIAGQLEYEDAWRVYRAMMWILISDEDGSKAATWYAALTHRIFDYESAFKAKHGCYPLNPGGPDWTAGPKGRA